MPVGTITDDGHDYWFREERCSWRDCCRKDEEVSVNLRSRLGGLGRDRDGNESVQILNKCTYQPINVVVM